MESLPLKVKFDRFEILTNNSVFGSSPYPLFRAKSLVLKKLSPGQLATAGSDE